MSVPRFVARFLAVFALLVVIGGAAGLTRGYAAVLRGAAVVTSPAVSNWWLEERPGPRGPEIWLRRGSQELRFGLSMEKLGLGLYPLLSLLLATPGLGWKRSAINLAIAVASLFGLDLVVVLAYPWLVVPGAVNDIAGTFLGLLTFVGAPVILWFALTFDRLRGVWRLGRE
jgi:hypothetical protein